MKRAISSTCLAAAFAVGLSAQAPSTSPGASAPAQSEKGNAQTLTVSGCLRAGDAPGSFVLANVKSDKEQTSTTASASEPAAGAPSPAGTSGTAGAPAAAGTSGTTNPAKDLENSTVGLTGSPAGVSLGDHVGHMVQVTGTLAGPNASASAAAPAEPAAASAAPKAQPSIVVTAFSMVSANCAQ